MRTIVVVVLVLAAVGVLAARAAAATRTSLNVTAPPLVGMGEDITVEARLTTEDGRPVAGATLTLFQVGAVGQRPMAEATTDANGAASFLHNEFTIAHLSLRVVFPGDVKYASARADTRVEISGIEVPPAVVMSHTPDPLVKAVLFSILGAVWLTYVFAGSCIIRIIRQTDDRKGVGALGSGR